MDGDPAMAGELVVIALAGEAALALCALDPTTGGLNEIDKISLPEAEGRCRGVPMACRSDGTRIFVAWRGEAHRLYTVAIDRKARRLTAMGGASLPASMCFASLSSCGKRVLTASNVGSVIAVSPIDSNGQAGEPILVREAYKAHCLVQAPNGFVYASSLRGDYMQCYEFAVETGALTPLLRTEMPAGSGPRHVVFTANGTRAYVLSEFAGILTCLDVDARTGALSVLGHTKLLADADVARGAELRLCPSEDILYASERSTSQLFAYRLGMGSEMDLINAVPAPDCPTAFTVSASGTHLIALGEMSGEAWVYRRDPTGALTLVARNRVGATPSWVLSL